MPLIRLQLIEKHPHQETILSLEKLRQHVQGVFVLDVGVQAVYHGAFCEEFGAGFGGVGARAAAAVAVD